MSSTPPSSNAPERDNSERDASPDPSPDPLTSPLDADLPEPYGGHPLPSPPSASGARPPDGEAPESWTEAEKDALELSDDDLALVAGGLPTPLLLSSEQARRVFRPAAGSPDEAASSSSSP